MRCSILSLLMVFVGVAGADSWVFRHVAVVSPHEGVVRADQTVVVSDGRIAAVGLDGSVAIPADAGTIEAKGHYLIPGLAEMHAHIPPMSNPEYLDEVLTLYLSQGVTTARGMLGEPGHLVLRDEIARGERLGPRIYTSGPSLNGNSVSSPEQAVEMVEAQHVAGYDHLKIHPGLTPDEFQAVAKRARELNMPFVGHVTAGVGAWGAIAAGQTCIDHLDGFVEALVPAGVEIQPSFFGFLATDHADESMIPKLAEAIAQAGTWVVPTEALMVRAAPPGAASGLMADPGMNHVSAETRAQWRSARQQFLGNPAYDAELASRFLALRLKLIGAMPRDRLLLGSDAPQVFNVPGFSIHRELKLYVEAGLSAAEALATGSVNVARYLGVADRRGKIQPGFDADLVLLAADPLADIENTRNIAGVMIAGRWLDQAWREEKLAAIASKN